MKMGWWFKPVLTFSLAEQKYRLCRFGYRRKSLRQYPNRWISWAVSLSFQRGRWFSWQRDLSGFYLTLAGLGFHFKIASGGYHS